MSYMSPQTVFISDVGLRSGINSPISGIQELSLEELDEVNGAIGPVGVLVAAAVILVAVQVTAGFIDGVSGHPPQTQKK